jgi:hypothetical protein
MYRDVMVCKVGKSREIQIAVNPRITHLLSVQIQPLYRLEVSIRGTVGADMMFRRVYDMLPL